MKINKEIFVLVFILILLVNSSLVFAFQSEEEFNNAFCKDYAKNYADARKQDWIDNNFNNCTAALKRGSLYQAIINKDFYFCSNLSYSLNWDSELKFYNINNFAFSSACKIYFVEETKNYGICDGKDEQEQKPWFSSSNSNCITYFALKEKNLTILDYYVGVNDPASDSQLSGGLKNFTSIEQCRTKWEYSESYCINYLTKNQPSSKETCYLMEDEGWMSKCFNDYAVENDDIDSCLKITNYRKNDCIRDIAVIRENVDLCEYSEDRYETEDDIEICKNSVPLAFDSNQSDRIFYVIIGPFLIFLFGIFVFVEERKRKIKECGRSGMQNSFFWIIAGTIFILGALTGIISLFQGRYSLVGMLLLNLSLLFLMSLVLSFKIKPWRLVTITWVSNGVVMAVFIFLGAITAASMVSTEGGLAALGGAYFGVYIASWIFVISTLIILIISYKKYKRIYSLIFLFLFIILLLVQIINLTNVFGITCIGPENYKQGCYYKYATLYGKLDSCMKIESYMKGECIKKVLTKEAIKNEDIRVCEEVHLKGDNLNRPESGLSYIHFNDCIEGFFTETQLPSTKCSEITSCELELGCYSEYNGLVFKNILTPAKCSEIEDNQCLINSIREGLNANASEELKREFRGAKGIYLTICKKDFDYSRVL